MAISATSTLIAALAAASSDSAQTRTNVPLPAWIRVEHALATTPAVIPAAWRMSAKSRSSASHPGSSGLVPSLELPSSSLSLS